MPNKKIQNPSAPFPKTSQMNDRDFIISILTTEKYFSNSYSVAINEMSHQVLFQRHFQYCKRVTIDATRTV